jgi:hypothetical protein
MCDAMLLTASFKLDNMCQEGLQKRTAQCNGNACHVQVAHQEGHYLGKLFRKHHIDGSGLPWQHAHTDEEPVHGCVLLHLHPLQ